MSSGSFLEHFALLCARTFRRERDVTLLWAWVKGEVARANATFRMLDVRAFVEDAFVE